jgi:hypothetical protein
MVVMSPVTHAAEFAPLHFLEGGDLFQEGFRFWLGFHCLVYRILYI